MSDNFKLIEHKRRTKLRKINQTTACNFTIDPSTILRRIQDSKVLFQSSETWKFLLATVLDSFLEIDEILCYGLGNFSDSYTARSQLAALLCFKDHFKSKVWCFDPVFQPIEKTLLQDLGIEVIVVNEEAKRIVNPNHNTLLFFPHCPKQLVNNFLWANWGTSLYKCIALSNSFKSIVEKNTTKSLKEVNCIRDICQITKEFPLIDLGEYSYVFNDTSIHIFQASLVPSPKFWSSRKEPIYVEHLEFIVKKIETNLNISCCNGSSR